MSGMEVDPMTEEIDLTQDDSDSNSSSDSGSEGEQENLQKINELEQQVETNPFMYEPHVQLINLLRKEGELDKLRNAREKMSQLFPLTEDLWIAWIQDEMSLASADSDYENIRNLFERAVKDYMSVDIWLEYCQFSIGRMNVKDGLSIVHDVFERAITAVGLHVTKGAIIWEAFREFEIAMLSTLQTDTETDLTPAQQEQIELQRKRILSLFARQLSVPLFDMEKTYEELREFNDNNVDQNVELSYQKAFDKLQKLQPYENALISTIPPHLEEYKAYIDFETEADEPSRIQCIYERALVENCLTQDLWLQYITYLESKLKIESLSLPVLERSIRNCPWSVNLWQAYIIAMERYGQPHEKIKELVDRALGAGLTRAEEFYQLWLIFLEYLRRRIDWENDHTVQLEELRSTFLRANRHLTDSFGSEGDASCNLLQFWARIEAYYCKDMTKARELWAEIMAQGHSSSAQMWLEYASLERTCGDVKHLRKVFQKALQATQDWPEAIGAAWMNFERDEGTLEQWELAKNKIEAKLQSVKMKREKEALKEAEMQRFKKQQRKIKTERKTIQQNIRTEEPFVITRKRKLPTLGLIEDSSIDVSKTDIDKEGFKIPLSPVAKKNIVEEPATKKLKEESFSNHGETVKHDPAKDDVTVFISNLSYAVEEEKIQRIFEQVGEIKQIRLVRDYRGRCKGFGYVEFGTLTDARNALKKDREAIDGRPMFVSECEDRRKPSSQPKFKYKVGLEKSKLFVRGLPQTATKHELLEVFKKHGEVVDLRIVTFRNGRSKGLAFVEYIDESTAALALVKTDGMKIGEHTISVAISNPPERKPQQGSGSGSSSQIIHSLGGGPKEVGIRGRGRTQVSLVPRAVQRASSSSTSVANGSSLNGESKKNEKVDSKPKTNEDFRNMLLKK